MQLNIDYDVRRNKLRELLQNNNVAGLYISNLINIRYLCGFTGSNAGLYVDAYKPDLDLFITDGRYTTQSANQVKNIKIQIAGNIITPILKHLVESNVSQLGLESEHLALQDYLNIKNNFPNLALVPTAGYVEILREVKDEKELDLLRKAGEISDLAMADMLKNHAIELGKTELQVARELEWKMFEYGAEALAFDTIVASGPNSAIPHHSPTDRVLQKGDFVKIDFGARFAGYHSDITRTFVLDNISDWQKEIYDIVHAAQQAGLDAAAPGVGLKVIDQAARKIIADAGYADNFVHGLGHGVGLEIHEAPTVSFRSEGKVITNNIITVEPGIYLPGKGGVRIEDTLKVGESDIEIFTNTSKELKIIQ